MKINAYTKYCILSWFLLTFLFAGGISSIIYVIFSVRWIGKFAAITNLIAMLSYIILFRNTIQGKYKFLDVAFEKAEEYADEYED